MRKLATVAQYAKANPAFTGNALRWHLFNAQHNGLAAEGAVVKIGRRVYLDVDAVDRWIAKKVVKAEAAA
jgi:hypothetical protein